MDSALLFFALFLRSRSNRTSGRRSASAAEAMTLRHMILQVVRSGGKCGVRVFAHVQQRVPSTYRYGANKTSASEMAQRGTKRVRTTMVEEQEGQYSSPTKRIRSKPTREEEEEEEDDEFDTSGSQDVDASQLCTQGEMIAMRNSEFVVSTDCGSSL